MRFDDDLEFTELIETTAFRLPPLSLQPIIENAVKHGMMGKEDGTLKVVLHVYETRDHIMLEVEDDGNGFDPNQTLNDGRSHIGIQNVRECLAHTVNGTLELYSTLGKGTLAVIRIPKEGVKQDEDLSSGR